MSPRFIPSLKPALSSSKCSFPIIKDPKYRYPEGSRKLNCFSQLLAEIRFAV